MDKIKINFTLNGEEVEYWASSNELLVDVLRKNFHLTGTKIGCRQGDCGACTVILNKKAVNSCLVPIMKVSNANIQTIEGLENGNSYHILQETYMDSGAVQCGFCTPGMILSGKALLDENPEPTEQEITEAISGNICRCTGYAMIKDAIRTASQKIRESKVKEG